MNERARNQNRGEYKAKRQQQNAGPKLPQLIPWSDFTVIKQQGRNKEEQEQLRIERNMMQPWHERRNYAESDLNQRDRNDGQKMVDDIGDAYKDQQNKNHQKYFHLPHHLPFHEMDTSIVNQFIEDHPIMNLPEDDLHIAIKKGKPACQRISLSSFNFMSDHI